MLQNGEIERLGDDQVRKVNVRLVAATNVNLQRRPSPRGASGATCCTGSPSIPSPSRRCASGAATSSCSPRHLLERIRRLRQALQGLTDRAHQALIAHDWPGNVRELENLIERGVLLAPEGGPIEVEHLFAARMPESESGAEVNRHGLVCNQDEASRIRVYERLLDEGFNLEDHEARLIDLAVRRAKGNLTHAARSLGITRRQLAYRLKQAQG